MGASVFEVRVDRAVADVRRAARAGLDGTEILRRTAAAIHEVAPIDAFCASTADPGSLLMTGGVARGMDAHVPDVGRVSRRFFERVYFQEQLHLVRLMLRRGESVVTPAEALGVPATETLRYREVLHPIGMAPEAALIFVDDGFRGGMEVMRGSDAPPFSARELDAMRRIAPEVGRGLRAAALRAQAAVPESAAGPGGDTPGVLVVDAGGDVVSATPAARALLAELVRPTPDPLEHGPLPTPVMMALGDVAQALRPGSTGRSEASTSSLRVMSRRGRWLTIHADLAEGRDCPAGERVVVIAPTPAAEVAWMRLSGRGLTPREEEVVRLVVGGLSTKQIAERLFIAEHTVQRHLSNIFDKVGVRSRRDLVKQVFTEQVVPSFAHVGSQCDAACPVRSGGRDHPPPLPRHPGRAVGAHRASRHAPRPG